MVFLAAGKSSRYGEVNENKLLAEKDGKPMYRYLLDQMKAYPMCTKVAVSGEGEILEYARNHGWQAEENRNPEKGISRSLQLGLAVCQREAKKLQGVLFAVCDQPGLRAETIEHMMELAWKNPGKIICAGTNEKLGNPVLLDKLYFPELMDITGDVGGKQVVKRHLDQVILLKTSEAELKDIDEKSQVW